MEEGCTAALAPCSSHLVVRFERISAKVGIFITHFWFDLSTSSRVNEPCQLCEHLMSDKLFRLTIVCKLVPQIHSLRKATPPHTKFRPSADEIGRTRFRIHASGRRQIHRVCEQVMRTHRVRLSRARVRIRLEPKVYNVFGTTPRPNQQHTASDADSRLES